MTSKASGLGAIDAVGSVPAICPFDVVLTECANYKDLEYLRNECEDGRRLVFTGKVMNESSLHPLPIISPNMCIQQAIHPNQVDVIQPTFVPNDKGKSISFWVAYENHHKSELTTTSLGAESLRAVRILKQIEKTHLANRGAGKLRRFADTAFDAYVASKQPLDVANR